MFANTFKIQIKKITILALLVTSLPWACENSCNDCLELTTKEIRVVDAEGNNLLYGSTAVYAPEQVTLTGAEGEPIAVFIDEGSTTLAFDLERDITAYTLRFSANEVDTITFELAERRSEQCCGTQTISTSTSLNGTAIANTDLITIIK